MRILEVCVDLDGGGIDRYLYNYCSRIPSIQFDFAIVDNNKKGILEEPLEKLGCNIYRVPRISNGVKENREALVKIMTQNKYDAVHVHLGYKGGFALKYAKKCGIKVRFVHAHIAKEPESKKQRLIRWLMTRIAKKHATHLVACGVDAAKWVWGEKDYSKGLVTIQNNAIETKKFKYSKEIGSKQRALLGIEENTLVVGHVGRLCDQKNQLRLLDIFEKIHKMEPNSCLVLIGRGELEGAVQEKANNLGLNDCVKLLGIRDDVNELLNMMDIFVFPSTHEGLPFTLIETQCNGLRAISSDAVTPLVKVSDCVEFLPLGAADEEWARTAIELARLGRDINACNQVIEAGYDIDTEAKKLESFYINNSRKE